MEKWPSEMTKRFFPVTYKEPGQKRLYGRLRACKGDLWSKGHNFRARNKLSRMENIFDFSKFHQKMAKSQDRLASSSFIF